MQKFKADSIGPEDMSEPPVSQDFGGFYNTARVCADITVPTLNDGARGGVGGHVTRCAIGAIVTTHLSVCSTGGWS